MKYRAIFDIPDDYKIGCAIAKICPNDGKVRCDTDFENAYAETRPYEMTVGELKAEAKKQGYRLVEIPQRIIKLLPCTCGCNHRTTWWTSGGLYFECQKCQKISPVGETENEAKRLWNKMVEEENGRSKEV